MKKKSIVVWIVLIIVGAWALVKLYTPCRYDVQQILIAQRLLAGEESDKLGDEINGAFSDPAFAREKKDFLKHLEQNQALKTI